MWVVWWAVYVGVTYPAVFWFLEHYFQVKKFTQYMLNNFKYRLHIFSNFLAFTREALKLQKFQITFFLFPAFLQHRR